MEPGVAGVAERADGVEDLVQGGGPRVGRGRRPLDPRPQPVGRAAQLVELPDQRVVLLAEALQRGRPPGAGGVAPVGVTSVGVTSVGVRALIFATSPPWRAP